MTPHVVRASSSLIDVFDVSLVGIELVTVEARVVVASIATYFAHSDALAESPKAAPARRVYAAKTTTVYLSPNGGPRHPVNSS